VNAGVCWGSLRERDHLGYPGVDGRMILKWILERGMRAWTGLIWLNDRDRERVPLKAVKNFHDPKMMRIF
jgi:hypothetical protein